MSYLEWIHIINFQNYENVKFHFDKGINVIIGTSDTGKTVLARALYWVLFNRPIGDTFLRDGASNVSVELKKENHTVKRVKTNTENYYIIDNDPKQRFDALKTNVPEEITKILGLTPTNLQMQLEQHFLLSVSSGEVAKSFNNVAGINDIDTSTSNINKLFKYTNTKKSLTKNLIDEKEKKLKTFENLEELEDLSTRVITLQSKKSELKSEIGLITRYIENINKTKIKIKQYQPFVNIEQQFKAVNILMKKENMMQIEVDQLHNTIAIIKKYKFDLENIQDWSAIKKQIKSISDQDQKQKAIQNSVNTLLSALSVIQNMKDKIETQKSINKRLLMKKERIEKELVDCPYCGKSL